VYVVVVVVVVVVIGRSMMFRFPHGYAYPLLWHCTLLFFNRPSSWAHRKYVVQKIMAKYTDNSAEDEDVNNEIIMEQLIREEITICTRVAEHYPKNYYAWTHRRYLLDIMLRTTCSRIRQDDPQQSPQNTAQVTSMFLSLMSEEWSSVTTWLERHVSDHSAVHYAGQVLQFLLRYTSNTTDAKIEVVKKALQLARELVDRFSDHEALWSFRRTVVSSILEYYYSVTTQSISSDEWKATLWPILWGKDVAQVYNSAIIILNQKDSLSPSIPPVHAVTYLLWVLVQIQKYVDPKTIQEAGGIEKMHSHTLSVLQTSPNVAHWMWRAES
jgi:hypothetical protein